MARGAFRRLFGRGAILAAALSIAALGLPALGQDDDGPDLLTRTLQNLLSDAGRQVRIRGFVGALSSQATIEEMSIADDFGVWIVLSDVVLDWNRAALLQGVVDVNELTAGSITLNRLPRAAPDDRLPSPTAREPFTLPDLPVTVDIDRIGTDRMTVSAEVTGQRTDLSIQGQMTLAGGTGSGLLRAERIDGQAGAMNFTGAFDNVTRRLSLDLSLTEGAGGIAATLLGIPGAPSLALSVAGEGPIATFGADVSLATEGEPRVTGTLTLIDESPQTTVLAGGGFSLALAGDLRPLLVPELHPFFGDQSRLLATGQRSEQGAFTFPELLIETNAARVQGRAAFDRGGLPRLVAVEAHVANPDGRPVLLPGTQGAAQVASVDLSIDYDAAQSRDWTLSAGLRDLTLPNAAIGHAQLAGRGRLGAIGTDTSAPVFEGVFDFRTEGIVAQNPAVQDALGPAIYGLASLVWPGPGAPVELSGLGVEGATLALTAFGTLDGLSFDGFAEFAAPDLSVFSGLAGRPLAGAAQTSLQGTLNPVTGALDITVDALAEDLRLDLPEADALLAGDTRILLSVLRDTSGTELRSFDLTAGTLAISAEGRIDPATAALSARIGADDLSLLGPGYHGRFQSDVLIDSDPEGLRLRADGVAIDIGIGSLPGADIVAALLTGANRVRLDARQKDGQTTLAQFGIEGPALSIAAQGELGAARTDLVLDLARIDLGALSPGGTGMVSGRVTAQGDATGVILDASGASAGAIRSGVALIDGLIGEGVVVNARARRDPQGGFVVQRLAIDAAGLVVSGQGTQAPDGAQALRLDARLPDLSRLSPLVSGALAVNADLTRPAGREGYDLALTASGPQSLSARVTGRIDSPRRVALDISAQIDGSTLNPFVEPANIAGVLRLQGRLVGAPVLDSLTATVTADGARYVQPSANVALVDLRLIAQLANGQVTVDLNGRSLTGGTGSVEGRIILAGGPRADLRVTVADYVVSNPQLFDARINGTFSVTGPLAQGPMVSGRVEVAQAEIRIPSTALGRFGTGVEGLRHVGEDAASRATRQAAGIARGQRGGGRAPVPLRLDLTLDAPGRVFVRGRGLDAELGGTLRLNGTTRAVVPAGQFSLVRGRLDLLGNRFVLTDGSASMIGSFLPLVSLTATTESNGVLTSVTLAGPANEPEIRFSSVPELPDEEILARLVFGVALTDLSPFQAAQLALSVATLTGRSDNSFLTRAREALSLDDLDFTVDDSGNTALRAGRYIGDRVYTDVSVDTAGQGEVSINLDLTDSVTLRGSADSGGGSSLGIFFERDY